MKTDTVIKQEGINALIFISIFWCHFYSVAIFYGIKICIDNDGSGIKIQCCSYISFSIYSESFIIRIQKYFIRGYCRR